jgi:hypothetical protein
VKAVTKALCGHEFSAFSISHVIKSLDAALTAFRQRLVEPYPYMILDARYERARDGGVMSAKPADRGRETVRAGVRFWRWTWPIAKAGRVGVTFRWR